MNIIFAIGVLLAGGYLGGRIARRVKLPEVTGYILAGIIIGPACFHLIPEPILEEEMNPIVDIALGLIAFSIGGSLNIERIKGLGKSIIWITLLQSLGAFLLVSVAVFLISLSTPAFHFIPPNKGIFFALVLGAIASATAPAATIAVINELRATGPLTTTLLAVVALDDAIAIIIFGICNATASSLTGGVFRSVMTPFFEVIGSLSLGIGFGFLLRLISKYLKFMRGFLIMSLGVVCLVSGTAMIFKLSPLLADMASGTVIINGLKRDKRFVSALDEFTPPLYALFFALAGTYLRLNTLFRVSFLGLGFIIARIIGKVAGSSIGGVISQAPLAVKRWLGFALLPQAGVAVGLVLIAHENPAFRIYGDIMVSIILASVAVNEILGPPFTAFALRKAEETKGG